MDAAPRTARGTQLWLLPRRFSDGPTRQRYDPSRHFHCLVSLQMIERLGALAVFLLMVGGLTGIAFVTPGGFLLDFVFSILCSCLRCGWQAARSEEHTSELQSLMRISYAAFCLKKKLQP